MQNAYEQLAAEGYIYSQEKRGYYVSPVERPLQAAARQPAPLPPEPEQKTYFLDLVTNSIDRAYFRCWSGTRPCCRPPPTTGRRSCAGPSATICASSVA